MISSIIFLILGLVLLVFSADFLVKGASKLAWAMGISPLVIGLTVVAYGTSAPELSVSVMSAFKGQADIALGNVVGSNIFNVLGILGISAVIVPLVVHRQLVRFDVPVMIVQTETDLLPVLGYAEAAVLALNAGCDLVLLCNQSVDGGAAVDALLDGLRDNGYAVDHVVSGNEAVAKVKRGDAGYMGKPAVVVSVRHGYTQSWARLSPCILLKP